MAFGSRSVEASENTAVCVQHTLCFALRWRGMCMHTAVFVPSRARMCVCTAFLSSIRMYAPILRACFAYYVRACVYSYDCSQYIFCTCIVCICIYVYVFVILPVRAHFCAYKCVHMWLRLSCLHTLCLLLSCARVSVYYCAYLHSLLHVCAYFDSHVNVRAIFCASVSLVCVHYMCTHFVSMCPPILAPLIVNC